MSRQIVLIKGAVETLGFFSEQMADALCKLGIRVEVWDMKHPMESRERIEGFVQKDKTCLWTFNFIGLSGESSFFCGERTIWETYDVDCYSILVDHPLYYGTQLTEGPANWNIVCIDRDHQTFVKRYYPRFQKVLFLPLAGTRIQEEQIPYSERKIELLFAGNYVQLSMLEMQLQQLEKDYRDFYYDRIHNLLEHPEKTIEEELVPALMTEFPDITDQQLMETMYHMCVVDLYVRSFFRSKCICTLAEKGYRIHVLGKDWDKAGCRRPENLILTGEVDSYTCLQYMKNSKISINVMPWFKNGTHDRIFNGMLQGCLVISDSSKYLNTILRDGKEYCEFSLEKYDQMCDIIEGIRQDEARAEMIAKAGTSCALKQHQWRHRVDTLLSEINI